MQAPLCKYEAIFRATNYKLYVLFIFMNPEQWLLTILKEEYLSFNTPLLPVLAEHNLIYAI